MKASDEITEEQSRQVRAPTCVIIDASYHHIHSPSTTITKGKAHRQMLFDIENAYNEFFRSLSGKSS